jgi:hypothetical protein
MTSRTLLLSGLMLLPMAAHAASDPQSPESRTGASRRDPCALLTVADVEAVLGPLAGPPFQAVDGRPRASRAECRYEAAGFHTISVKVEWEDGGQIIGMMGAVQGMVNKAGLADLKLFDGTTVSGAWDRATVSQCCEFNALRGDQLVTIGVGGSHATLQQAASLADAAVKRLNQPLAIAGEDGIKAAEERFRLRPQRRNVCDLVTQADAEAIAGVHLSKPPRGNQDSCSYSWPLAGFDEPYTIELLVTWLNGFDELRQKQFVVGTTSAMIGFGKPSAPPKPVAGPWDDYAQTLLGVMATKADVLVSIESGPVKADISRSFVRRAIDNLMRPPPG